MKQILSKISLWPVALIAIGIFGALSYGGLANANPSILTPQQPVCLTSNATTSLRFMSSGKATSTMADTCYLLVPDNRLSDNLVLNVWFAASSSPGSVLGILPMYSHDNRSWYTGANISGNSASSSASIFYTQVASTTDPITGLKTATSSTNIVLQNPERAAYMKLYFYIPAGSQPGAVYAELRNAKEILY